MHKHNIVLSRKMLLIIIVIVLSPSPSCMLVIVGMNTISDVFLNALIRARQKSSVLSLTLIFLLYFYIVLANIEPSLVQRLVPGWLQNIYKHSLIVIVPGHTMFSYSVSHWKLPLCRISVTGRKKSNKISLWNPKYPDVCVFERPNALYTMCMQMLQSHLLQQDENEFSFGLQRGMLCNLLLFENWVLANDIIMM